MKSKKLNLMALSIACKQSKIEMLYSAQPYDASLCEESKTNERNVHVKNHSRRLKKLISYKTYLNGRNDGLLPLVNSRKASSGLLFK